MRTYILRPRAQATASTPPALMTDLVWRLRKFQPQWRGFVKWAHVLGPESNAGRPARKRAITACVRLLFIDLWRLFTHQLHAADIGLN